MKLRQQAMIDEVLGQNLIDYLNDKSVIEIMVNPDGYVWLDTLNRGKFTPGDVLAEHARLNIIKLIASLNKLVVNNQQPELACEIPFANARFQAWIPPVAEQPTFTIRKKAKEIFSLANYVERGYISHHEQTILKNAIAARMNILVAGSTGSGKTTFVNALLNELTETSERIVVLEDLPELQFNCRDVVRLTTTATKNMRDLVKGSLRMRPDRIIIGEVRDGAALELLKAWNTGHSGGFITIHANCADSALARLENLILEAISFVPPNLIEQAIDIIVFMRRHDYNKYKIAEMKFISERSDTIKQML